MLHWKQVGFLMETHKKHGSEKARGKIIGERIFDRCRSVVCLLTDLHFAGKAEDFVFERRGILK